MQDDAELPTIGVSVAVTVGGPKGMAPTVQMLPSVEAKGSAKVLRNFDEPVL
ncbi:MAG: hypothetical protein PVJ17_12690 [Lysobacterales bacterium]